MPPFPSNRNQSDALDRVTTTTGPDGGGSYVMWDKLDVGEQHEFHPNVPDRVTTYTHDANRKVTSESYYPNGLTGANGAPVAPLNGTCVRNSRKETELACL